jgi:Bacterial sugar transferase
MRADAEAAGPQWASDNDPRATRLGRFLRQYRLDELPQFINVIRGEMSLVGPRPERPEFVEELRKQISYYDERHSVRPGITGWAQTQYRYGSSAEDAAFKLGVRPVLPEEHVYLFRLRDYPGHGGNHVFRVGRQVRSESQKLKSPPLFSASAFLPCVAAYHAIPPPLARIAVCAH